MGKMRVFSDMLDQIQGNQNSRQAWANNASSGSNSGNSASSTDMILPADQGQPSGSRPPIVYSNGVA
jgi:hypothetical protein